MDARTCRDAKGVGQCLVRDLENAMCAEKILTHQPQVFIMEV